MERANSRTVCETNNILNKMWIESGFFIWNKRGCQDLPLKLSSLLPMNLFTRPSIVYATEVLGTRPGTQNIKQGPVPFLFAVFLQAGVMLCSV